MFCAAMYAFAVFLIRQNPEHLLTTPLELAFPTLFFMVPFMAARATGKFVPVMVFSYFFLFIGCIAFLIYSYLTSFTLRLPLTSLAVAVFELMVSALLGDLVGYFLFRRHMEQIGDSTKGNNGP